MASRPSRLRSPPRLERSAPAQNAGGAPVTTTAPTASSASIWSNALHIAATMSVPSALRRPGSANVTTATPSSTANSTGDDGASSAAIADHGGRMPEELLDIALVAVGRRVAAHRLAQAHRFDERLDRAGRRVVVAEAGLLE